MNSVLGLFGYGDNEVALMVLTYLYISAVLLGTGAVGAEENPFIPHTVPPKKFM